MHYIAALALAGGASAAVLPRQEAGCCFQLTASGGESGQLSQLSDGQNRIHGTGSPATYCLNNGQITDSHGRGCILTPPTTQFQCDTGATPSGGFSVGGSGQLEHNGNGTFYACGATSAEYNVYTTPVSGQNDCVEISLSTGGKCSGTGSGSSAAASSTAPAAASSAPAESAPAYGQSSSHVASSSAPAQSAETSQPAVKTSQPAVYTSQPKAATSQPAAETSQPAVYTSQPKPATSQPAAETSQPAVYTSQPKPETSQPAAETSQPAVYTSQPKPATSQPAVASSAPAASVPVGYSSVAPSAPAQSAPATHSVGSSASAATSSPHITGSAPAGSAQPQISSTGTKPASSGPAASGSACQTGLTGAYQTPHAIVPVSSESQDTAYGTSYFGQINSTTSTIFNFDIPQSYEGKECTIVFLFPEKQDLETSSYTFSGSGSISFSELSSPAQIGKTSWSNAPSVSKDLGSIAVQPGNSYVVANMQCQAGTREAIELSSEGGLSLNFFEDWNPSSLGLYITSC